VSTVPDLADQPERQQLAVLTVEHMDGLRIDRLSLRVVGGSGATGAQGGDGA
jgi:hypothetical protein